MRSSIETLENREALLFVDLASEVGHFPIFIEMVGFSANTQRKQPHSSTSAKQDTSIKNSDDGKQ